MITTIIQDKMTDKNTLDKLTKRIKFNKALTGIFIGTAAAGAISYLVGDFLDRDKLSAIGGVSTMLSTLLGIATSYRIDELEDIKKYFQDVEMNPLLKYKYEPENIR